jgi:hypothetical protein
MGVANGGPETGATTTTSARHLTAGLPKPGPRSSLGLPPHTRLAMSLANAGCNSSMTMAGSLIAVGRNVPCGLAGCQSTYSDVTGSAPTRSVAGKIFPRNSSHRKHFDKFWDWVGTTSGGRGGIVTIFDISNG